VKGDTLTRADLTEAVHQEVGLTRQDCAMMVERTLDLIAEALQNGEIVKLSGFGVFQVREKRARMGRNPKTGEPAAIDPRRVISFRASQVMKAKVEQAIALTDGHDGAGFDGAKSRGAGAVAGEAIG
jgi:integration host factor subunit alpha